MSLKEVYLDNSPISLGTRIGKGGEGEVYILADDHSRVVKLYTLADLKEREAKVQAMVVAGLARRAPLVAFPASIVRRKDGRFAGFLMRLVAHHKPLHELYSPGSRKHQFPHADYRFLVRAAANIARAVASVHAAGCVIGDINHSGILVSKNATVALIDADSFQVEAGSKRFFCKVGVPEYTPPELQGTPLGSVARTANHDGFGLAVAIFLILFMGRHPFVGTVRRGEIPPLNEAIRDFRFVYAEDRDVGMDQPPGTPVLSDFSAGVAAAFQRAFSKEGVARRPSAIEWVSIVEELEGLLVACGKNRLHFASKRAASCPWCEMEERLGNVLFLPYLPEARFADAAFDPGANGFSLEVVWSRIVAVKLPPSDGALPRIAAVTLAPSPAAVEAKSSKATSNAGWRVTSAVAAVLVLLAAPAAWILWVPLGLFAAFGGKTETKKPDTTLFVSRYVEIERRWTTEVEAWRKRSSLAGAQEILLKLKVARDEYGSLANLEKQRIDVYNANRREAQLQAYLDGFQIRNAKVKGIGPAKEAALASFGVETAADVSLAKVLRVPGFGETNSQPLIEWRERLARRFVYRSEVSDSDRREVARIRTEVAAKGGALRKQLLSGGSNLALLAARSVAAMAMEDPILNRLHLERQQAKIDLEFLGVPLPSVPGAYARQSAGGLRPASVPVPSPPPGSIPSCPRCGTAMVRRVARRGARAGSSFWGCIRYPQCKGTRN